MAFDGASLPRVRCRRYFPAQGHDEKRGMRKLEQAARRLEGAVRRLEAAVERVRGDATEKRRLSDALAAAKAEYATLEAKIERVTNRLDGTIERINQALDD